MTHTFNRDPITLTLSEPIQRRMMALFQQRQAIENDLRSTLATAVEAMGYEGVIIVGANAGTAVVQWAQATAGVSDTTLLKDSYLVYELLN